MTVAAALALTLSLRLGTARLAVLTLAAVLLCCERCDARTDFDAGEDLALAQPAPAPPARLLAGRRIAARPAPRPGELIACLPELDGGSRILFELPADAGQVRLRIEDERGAELALLHDGALPAGEHSAAFDYQSLVGDTCWAVLESAGQRRSMKLHLMQ